MFHIYCNRDRSKSRKMMISLDIIKEKSFLNKSHIENVLLVIAYIHRRKRKGSIISSYNLI